MTTWHFIQNFGGWFSAYCSSSFVSSTIHSYLNFPSQASISRLSSPFYRRLSSSNFGTDTILKFSSIQSSPSKAHGSDLFHSTVPCPFVKPDVEICLLVKTKEDKQTIKWKELPNVAKVRSLALVWVIFSETLLIDAVGDLLGQSPRYLRKIRGKEESGGFLWHLHVRR